MSKFKFYIINFAYFVITLIVGTVIFFILIKSSINSYWMNLYKKSSLSPEIYFRRHQELIRMTVDSQQDMKSPRVFTKKLVSDPVTFFTAKFTDEKKTIKLWYTPDFFFRHLDSIKARVVSFILLWIAFAMVCYYILLKKILYLPLSTLVEGKEYFDVTGILKNLKNVLNLNKNQIELSHTYISVLLQAAKSVSSHLDLNQTLSKILDVITGKFPSTSCAVVLLDDDNYLKIKSARGFSTNFIKSLRLKVGQGFIGECVETKKIVVIQDTDIDGKEEIRHIDIEGNIKSFVGVPIIVENRAIGTLVVTSTQKTYFTHDIVSVIATLSEYLSIAITNAELYGRVKDFNRRLETEVSYTTKELLKTNTKLVNKIWELKSITEIFNIASEVSSVKVINRSLSKIAEIVGVDYLAFFIYNSDVGSFQCRVQIFDHKEIPFDRALTGVSVDDSEIFREVILTKKLYLTENIHGLKLAFIPQGLHIKSLVVIPVMSSGIIRGILFLANRAEIKFSEEDIDFLKLASLLIGIFIEKQNLEEEIRKLKA